MLINFDEELGLFFPNILGESRQHTHVSLEYFRLSDESLGGLVEYLENDQPPVLAPTYRIHAPEALLTRLTVDGLSEVPKECLTLSVEIVPPPLGIQAEWQKITQQSNPSAISPDVLQQLRDRVLDAYWHHLPFGAKIVLDSLPVDTRNRLSLGSSKPMDLALLIEGIFADQMLPLAADGQYQAILTTLASKNVLLVRYRSRTEVPLLLECIAAARRMIPRAFKQPLYKSAHQPTSHETTRVIATRTPFPESLDRGHQAFADLADHLGTIQPGDGEEVQKGIARLGTEFLGWFQPYHSYGDGTWGIVIHDRNILRLAEELHRQLRKLDPGIDFYQALQPIMWLVLEHELFHARVETTAVLSELSSHKPLFRKYYKHVYVKALSASGPLEEALANYVALGCVEKKVNVLYENRIAGAIFEFIRQLFETSPPGYRDYAEGADYLTWRKLATQLFTHQIDSDDQLVLSQSIS